MRLHGGTTIRIRDANSPTGDGRVLDDVIGFAVQLAVGDERVLVILWTETMRNVDNNNNNKFLCSGDEIVEGRNVTSELSSRNEIVYERNMVEPLSIILIRGHGPENVLRIQKVKRVQV